LAHEEVIPTLHELFGYVEIPHINRSRANAIDFAAMHTRRTHEVVINRYRHCIDILNYHDIEASMAYRLLMTQYAQGYRISGDPDDGSIRP